MGIGTLVLLAVGMSVDAFAASLARGAAQPYGSLKALWRTALLFGAVECVAPVLGWLAGRAAAQFIEAYDHWAAFVLLAALGAKMVYGGLRGGDAETAGDAVSGSLLLTLTTAVATSIDSVIAGVGLAFLEVHIAAAALAIGLATTLMSALGLMLGGVLGARAGRWAEVAGGLVLMGIGVFILAEHLAWFRAA